MLAWVLDCPLAIPQRLQCWEPLRSQPAKRVICLSVDHTFQRETVCLKDIERCQWVRVRDDFQCGPAKATVSNRMSCVPFKSDAMHTRDEGVGGGGGEKGGGGGRVDRVRMVGAMLVYERVDLWVYIWV